MNIYHVVLPTNWASFEGQDSYVADSLESEGFIHCSYQTQLEGVLGRYYEGAGEVLILTIDPDRLSSNLVVEESTGGELYPHIYGPINKSAVISIDPRHA